jgi:dipeptidyl aminopeptidase/acylaminoacyl peptidase
VFSAGSPTEASSLVSLSLSPFGIETLRRSSEVQIEPERLSIAESIEFLSAGGRLTHAFFYRPKSADFEAPAGEKPPLLVKVHGGPTGASTSSLSLWVQYWTSRGFAVLDVNYGGSSGFGREYRDRLKGQWGVVDVEDVIAGARHLVQEGKVDPSRLAATGGSAGGFTVLSALTLYDVFRAGASHYGIGDLEQMARDARSGLSHKFESRYDEGLVAKYPEQAELYRQRSPIHAADRIACPVIFFQGLEDKVVLPNQTERMVECLRAKKRPVAYVAFEGEGHGFRRAETIKRVLDAELYFYSRAFGFELAEPVEPVRIDNL